MLNINSIIIFCLFYPETITAVFQFFFQLICLNIAYSKSSFATFSEHYGFDSSWTRYM